jgi:hypothetical protein
VPDGIAGIGLALIAAVSDSEPAWDECLFKLNYLEFRPWNWKITLIFDHENENLP